GARDRPERGDLHRLDDARSPARRAQAAAAVGWQRQRRLLRRAHPPDLRDHAARPRLRAARDARGRSPRGRPRSRRRPRRVSASSLPATVDRIVVEFPATDGYRAVGRLVLGGLVSRFELPLDRVEDLLLAVESLLVQPHAGETTSLEASAA